MGTKEKNLYMLYFYNSVIEFIFFVILYIEIYGAASLKTLCQHVKFFKTEVATLILCFNGKHFEDKLCQMLRMFDCFMISDDKINILNNNFVKDIILEDLVIGKSVDLVLRGIDNISEICDNLKFNNVIFIQKENMIDMFKRSTHLSIKDKQVLTLNHVHALLGYDDSLSNSVISYFHGILCYETVISFNEIKNHIKFLSICGIRNMLVLFSILHCSQHFLLQDGFITLKKKSPKYPRLKPISMDLLYDKFSSRALPIGQIIHSTYGSYLHKWTGEIGSLSINSGVVYCVVDFTNGYQGIFSVYFNETSLKVVSEIDDIKKYLKLRDRVEFDAEYYNGKILDRCWWVTRLKILHESKLQYNKELFDKLCNESELSRKSCNNNRCLLANSIISSDSLINYSLKDKNLNSCNEILLSKAVKNEIVSVNNPADESITSKNDMKHYSMSDLKEPRTFYSSFSNLIILDYSLMFGFIYMLMEDKGFAIAKCGTKFYNILFMKNSIYTQNGGTDLIRGQKVLALIPFYNELEAFCISTFIYGLNKAEFDETEKNNVSPDEFAVTFFKKKETELLKCKFCSKSNVLNGLLGLGDRAFNINIKQKLLLNELYDHISRLYKTPLKKNCIMQFLPAVCKMHSKENNISRSIFHFLIQLSRCFIKSNAIKCGEKMKRPLSIVNQFILQNKTIFQDISTIDNDENPLDKNTSPSCSKLSLGISSDGIETFKTCRSFDSIENSQNKSEYEKEIASIDNMHFSIEKKSSSSSCIYPIRITVSGNEDSNSLKRYQSLNSIANLKDEFQDLSYKDNLGSLIKDCSVSNNYLSPSKISPSSNESLNSFKTGHSSDSAEIFHSCGSDSLTPDHSPVSIHSSDELQTSEDKLIQTKEFSGVTPEHSLVISQSVNHMQSSNEKLLKNSESICSTIDHSFVSSQSIPVDQIPSSDKTLTQLIESTCKTSYHLIVPLKSKDQIPSLDDKFLIETTELTSLTPNHLSVSLQPIDQNSTSENIHTDTEESKSSASDHPSGSLMSSDHVKISNNILNGTETSTGSTLHHPCAFLQPVDQIPAIFIHSTECTSLTPASSSISLHSTDQILSNDVLFQTEASCAFPPDHSFKPLRSRSEADCSSTFNQKAIKSKELVSLIPDHSYDSFQFVDQSQTSSKFSDTKACDKKESFLEAVEETKCDLIKKALNSNAGQKCKKLHDLRSVYQSKYLGLKSLPMLKPSMKKKRHAFLYDMKLVCRYCTRSPVTISANLSLISSSFFYYTTKLNGFEITLPLPKTAVPRDVQECIKLNSCFELTIVPHAILNLSHILKVNTLS